MLNIISTEFIHHLNSNPMNVPSIQNTRDIPSKLICVSGNFNVGKSSFMEKLGSHVFHLDKFTIIIDECAFKHL
ncbi:MAG: hypothetical protein H6R25_3705 [Proteobacteria bacterium]|nr:hypothetical protein [Pseudomonadota bacterium]